MVQLMYDFESVIDRETGEDKLTPDSRYTNPVFIGKLRIGQGAMLNYIDRPIGFTTSKVEEFAIINNKVFIITQNTEMMLKPYIRGGDK